MWHGLTAHGRTCPASAGRAAGNCMPRRSPWTEAPGWTDPGPCSHHIPALTPREPGPHCPQTRTSKDSDPFYSWGKRRQRTCWGRSDRPPSWPGVPPTQSCLVAPTHSVFLLTNHGAEQRGDQAAGSAALSSPRLLATHCVRVSSGPLSAPLHGAGGSGSEPERLCRDHSTDEGQADCDQL